MWFSISDIIKNFKIDKAISSSNLKEYDNWASPFVLFDIDLDSEFKNNYNIKEILIFGNSYNICNIYSSSYLSVPKSYEYYHIENNENIFYDQLKNTSLKGFKIGSRIGIQTGLLYRNDQEIFSEWKNLTEKSESILWYPFTGFEVTRDMPPYIDKIQLPELSIRTAESARAHIKDNSIALL